MDMYTTAQDKGYKAERYEFDEHLDKFDLTKNDPKRIVVILCSSTGDGEAPDNGNKFFRYLSKNARLAKENAEDSYKIFSHLKYTILGLGDSDYSSLHKCPKHVNTCFETLGAKLFHYFGKADEAIGLELEVEPWIKYFWKALPKVVEEVKAEQLELIRKNTRIRNEEKKVLKEVDEDEAREKPSFKAKIVHKTVETDKYRHVLRLEIELDREITAEDDVKPGSYALIYPENDPDTVKQFIDLCHWESSEDLVKKLTEDLDFLQPVNTKSLKLLTSDTEPFSKETARYNYFDIISYLQPKEEVNKAILEYIPKLKARYYSLASDLVNTSKFEICFTVEVHEQQNVFTKDHTVTKKGVCSHYLARLAEEEKREFTIKLNKISMFTTSAAELQNKQPIIIVSHGTAIAPFISVLKHFKKLLEHKEIDTIGDIDIYYGIRNKNVDFLFQKVLTELMDYFSTANPSGKYTIHISESRPGKFISYA